MEKIDALEALSALAHDIRLDVIRLLVKAGPRGALAGEIADQLDVRSNTLSNNLTVLAAARLVRSAREGRSVRYLADMDKIRDLLGFLVEDCCGGSPELCQPLLQEITVVAARRGKDG